MSNGAPTLRGSSELQRRRPFLDPKPRILAVCEGSVTEPRYIASYRDFARNALVDVNTTGGNTDPLSLVEETIERRDDAARLARQKGDRFLAYNEVWSVFDRDSHATFDEAKTLADRESVRLAVSNPCFELWLLLHYEHQGGHISCQEVIRTFQAYHPEYDKVMNFSELHDHYDDARQRARRLWRERRRAQDRGGNPSTRVYSLTEQIRQTAEKVWERAGRRAAAAESP